MFYSNMLAPTEDRKTVLVPIYKLYGMINFILSILYDFEIYKLIGIPASFAHLTNTHQSQVFQYLCQEIDNLVVVVVVMMMMKIKWWNSYK